MDANCDTCKYRQMNLDPEGCWKGISTTGWLGRMFIKWFGCIYYDELKL